MTSSKNDSQNNETKEIEQQKDVIYTTDTKSQQVLIQKKNEDEPVSHNDLRNNDSKILSLLYQDNCSKQYSFKGLMRKLSLHQQSLTRALHRLEDLGLVEKSEAGYKLSKNRKIIHIPKSMQKDLIKIRNENEFLPLIHTYIPINIGADQIVAELVGKWFNKLRWYGLIKNETGYVLQWISDDKIFQVNLKITSNYITIETDAISDKQKVEAMVSAQRIFEQMTKILQNKLEYIGPVLKSNYHLADQNN